MKSKTLKRLEKGKSPYSPMCTACGSANDCFEGKIKACVVDGQTFRPSLYQGQRKMVEAHKESVINGGLQQFFK